LFLCRYEAFVLEKDAAKKAIVSQALLSITQRLITSDEKATLGRPFDKVATQGANTNSPIVYYFTTTIW